MRRMRIGAFALEHIPDMRKEDRLVSVSTEIMPTKDMAELFGPISTSNQHNVSHQLRKWPSSGFFKISEYTIFIWSLKKNFRILLILFWKISYMQRTFLRPMACIMIHSHKFTLQEETQRGTLDPRVAFTNPSAVRCFPTRQLAEDGCQWGENMAIE